MEKESQYETVPEPMSYSVCYLNKKWGTLLLELPTYSFYFLSNLCMASFTGFAGSYRTPAACGRPACIAY